MKHDTNKITQNHRGSMLKKAFRGCLFIALFLYALQIVATTSVLLQGYHHRKVGETELTMRYQNHLAIMAYTPGIGVVFCIMHSWWGMQLTAKLPDGRQYVWYSEDFPSFKNINVIETPDDIELINMENNYILESIPMSPTEFYFAR